MLAVPAVVWAVVGRPLVWVGVGTAAVAGVAAAVVAAVGVVVVAFVLATGDGDAPPFAATSQSAPEPIVSCDSGIAVTNPAANSELVRTARRCWALRDRIRGTGRLNWAGGKAMSEWMGVTVSGTPQRVTALNLADLGLDGELSGLLGNLMALTTLDLSGNALTGMLPSKLALLTSLTTVAYQGRPSPGALRKCWVMWRQTTSARQAWTSVARPLGSWPTTPGTRDYERDPAAAPRIPSGATYYVDALGAPGRALVFDVPDGASLIFTGVILVNRQRA